MRYCKYGQPEGSNSWTPTTTIHYCNDCYYEALAKWKAKQEKEKAEKAAKAAETE